MHRKTKNVNPLRHDLRNGPNHVFSDHARCNPAVNKGSDPLIVTVTMTTVPMAKTLSSP